MSVVTRHSASVESHPNEALAVAVNVVDEVVGQSFMDGYVAGVVVIGKSL